MDREAAKRLVLARRARFVAAAIASAGLVHCDACKPQPCLSAVYVPPEGGPVPQVCLSVIATPEDASSDADAGGGDAGDAAVDAGRDAGSKTAPKTTDATKAPDAGKARPRACLSDL